MGKTKRKVTDDPRPTKYRNMVGYNDYVRNAVINHCSNENHDITMRFMYPKAPVQYINNDHDYLKLPVLEQWVENGLKVTDDDITRIELTTRSQSQSKIWHDQRKWRITASRFGEICHMTLRRDKDKLCYSITHPNGKLHAMPAIAHGRKYEESARKLFEEKSGKVVEACGLVICEERPYLAASCDGFIGENSVLEIKCPFTGRNDSIGVTSAFPFLEEKDGSVKLKLSSNYYCQVQGQLYVTKRQTCYFVVYTHRDLLIDVINYDKVFVDQSLLPKLDTFYKVSFRKHISTLL